MTDYPSPVPSNTPVNFPLYVRILAVFHVLSLILGPVGGVVLGGIAGFRWTQHGMDAWVIGLLIAGPCWFMFCNIFRWWFVRWGRRHWPEPVDNTH